MTKAPSPVSDNSVRAKWNALWRDRRSYLKRLSIAAFPASLFAFTLFFFGPLDIFCQNQRFLDSSLRLFLLPFGVMFVGGAIVLALLAALLRGKVFNFIVCCLFGVSLCCYIQGNFLNIDLGSLDGNAIQWQIYASHAMLNLGVWALILAAVFAASYFFKRHFFTVVRFLCCALIVMQAGALIANVAVVTPVANGEAKAAEERELQLSGADQYTVASSDNVVVFILDSFNNKRFDKVCKANPDILDPFHDFTSFSNCNTGYVGTFPSELHIITGHIYDFALTYEQNFQAAWDAERTKRLSQELKDNGYQVKLYTKFPKHLCGSDMSRITGFFSNFSAGDYAPLSTEAIRQFTTLSCYRYAPHAMKANFWMYSGDISLEYTVDPIEHNHEFVQNLRKQGLKALDEQKVISFYMLLGPHGPHNLDSQGNYVAEGTSAEEQGAGFLRAVADYIAEMKRLGVYDDATIIVTTDHGNRTYTQSICLIKRPGDSADAVTFNSSPVDHLDLMSTILQSRDLPYAHFGPSMFDFNETDVRERSVFTWMQDDRYPTLNRNYNTMWEFTYTGGTDVINALTGADEDYQVHVLLDSYY